jgi:broad specificity phosphatase PhoE
MKLGKIYLLRHGEVAWNSKNAYVGSTDLPLNDTGLKQAELAANCLKSKDISAVYSSDLTRAMQTAGSVAAAIGLDVNPLSALREVDYGFWEGLSEEEIAGKYPDILAPWRSNVKGVRIPGGETFQELCDRAFPAFTRIAEKNQDGNVVVVAHKSANRVLICAALGVDINLYRSIGQDNACINRIDRRSDGRFVIESINDTCHLGSSLHTSG